MSENPCKRKLIKIYLKGGGVIITYTNKPSLLLDFMMRTNPDVNFGIYREVE